MAQIGEVPGGGRPFGDIYTVNTPALDRFGQQMYAQEIQRQNQMRQDAKALDEEFSRNAANIRDADLPEYSKAYQDYKTAYQQSLKSKKEYSPEQQMELLRKRANVYSVIKNSKDTDAVIKDYAKRINSDTKGVYNTDASNRLRGYNSLPSNQISDKHFDDLMWKFGNTDFSKEEGLAKGKPRSVGQKLVGVDPNDPNSDLYSTYDVGNNYLDYFNTLATAITGAKKTEDYQRLVNNQYTPEEQQQLTEAFNKKINDPLYKELYGVDGTTTFPSWAYNTPIGNALRIATMKSVVDAPLVPTTKSIPNKTRMMLAKDAIGDENATTKFNRSKILKSMNGSNQWVSEVVGAFQGGDKQAVKNAIGKMFSGNGTYELEPDAYGILDNGQLAITARPRGLTEKGRKKPAEQIIIDKNDSDIAHKLEGWYQRLTGSDTKGERTIISNSNVPQPKKATAKSYDVGGKSYSHNDLLTMGYTEDQIQQAIKLGTIK